MCMRIGSLTVGYSICTLKNDADYVLALCGLKNKIGKLHLCALARTFPRLFTIFTP